MVEEKIGCKDGRITVFNSDPASVSLEMCAKEVPSKSECSKTFFFNRDKGRCFCKKRGFTCKRKTYSDVNEYSLTEGKYNNITSIASRKIAIKLFQALHDIVKSKIWIIFTDSNPGTLDLGAFGGRIGLQEQFWINAERDATKENHFFYDDNTPAIANGPISFISNDEATNNLGMPYITLRTTGANYPGKYRAISASPDEMHGTFCMIDAFQSSTTEVTSTATSATSTSTATTATTTTETIQSLTPVGGLPKMPKFCPIKHRRKRESQGKLI